MVISDEDDSNNCSTTIQDIPPPLVNDNDANKNEHSKIDKIDIIKKKQTIIIKGRRVQRRSKITCFDDEDDLDEGEIEKKSKKRDELNKLFGFKSAIQNKLLNTGKILSHWNDNNKLDINLIGRTNTIINQIANTSFDVIFSPENIATESFDNWNSEFDDSSNAVLNDDKLYAAQPKDITDNFQSPQSVESLENVREDSNCTQESVEDNLTAQQIVDKSFAVQENPDIVSSFNSWFSDIRSATKVAASTTLTHTVKALTQNAQIFLNPNLALVNSLVDDHQPEKLNENECLTPARDNQFEDKTCEDSMSYKNTNAMSQIDDWGDDWDDEVIQLKSDDKRLDNEQSLNDTSDINNLTANDNRTGSCPTVQSSNKSSLAFNSNIVSELHQPIVEESDSNLSKSFDLSNSNDNDWDACWEDQDIVLDDPQTSETPVAQSTDVDFSAKPISEINDWNVQWEDQEIVLNESQTKQTKILTTTEIPAPNCVDSINDKVLDAVTTDWDVQWEGQEVMDESSTIPTIESDFSESVNIVASNELEYSACELPGNVADALESNKTEISTTEASNINISNNDRALHADPTDWDAKWEDQEIILDDPQPSENSIVQSVADVDDAAKSNDWDASWEDQEIILDEFQINQTETSTTKIPTSNFVDSANDKVLAPESNDWDAKWEDQEIVLDDPQPSENSIVQSVADVDVAAKSNDWDASWEDQEIILDELETHHIENSTTENSVSKFVDSVNDQIINAESTYLDAQLEDQEIVLDDPQPSENSIVQSVAVVDDADKSNVWDANWEDQEIVVDELEHEENDEEITKTKIISSESKNFVDSVNIDAINWADQEIAENDELVPNETKTTDWGVNSEDQDTVDSELKSIETKENEISSDTKCDGQEIINNSIDKTTILTIENSFVESVNIEEEKIVAVEPKVQATENLAQFSEEDKQTDWDVEWDQEQNIVVGELEPNKVHIPTSEMETVQGDFVQTDNMDILINSQLQEQTDWEDQKIALNDEEIIKTNVSLVNSDPECDLSQSVNMNVVNQTSNDWDGQWQDQQIVNDEVKREDLQNDLVYFEKNNDVSTKLQGLESHNLNAHLEEQDIVLSAIGDKVTQTENSVPQYCNNHVSIFICDDDDKPIQANTTENNFTQNIDFVPESKVQNSDTDWNAQWEDQEIVLDDKEIQPKDSFGNVLTNNQCPVEGQQIFIDDSTNQTVESGVVQSDNIDVGKQHLVETDWNAQWEDQEIINEKLDEVETQLGEINSSIITSFIDNSTENNVQTVNASTTDKLVLQSNDEIEDVIPDVSANNQSTEHSVWNAEWEDQEIAVKEIASKDEKVLNSIKSESSTTDEQQLPQSDSEIEIEDAIPTSSYDSNKTRMEKFFVYNSGLMYFKKNLSEHFYPNPILETKLDLRNLEDSGMKVRPNNEDEIEGWDTQDDDNFEPNLDQDDNNLMFNLTGSVEELCDQVLEEMNNDDFNEDILIRRVSDEWCDNLGDHKEENYWQEEDNQTNDSNEYCPNNYEIVNEDSDSHQPLDTSDDSIPGFNQTNSSSDYSCGQLDNLSYFNEPNNQNDQAINLGNIEQLQELSSNNLSDMTQLIDNFTINQIQPPTVEPVTSSNPSNNYSTMSSELTNLKSSQLEIPIVDVELVSDFPHDTDNASTKSIELSQTIGDELAQSSDRVSNEKIPDIQQPTKDQYDQFLNEGWDDWGDNDESNAATKCEQTDKPFILTSDISNKGDLNDTVINELETKEIQAPITDDKMEENQSKLVDSNLIVDSQSSKNETTSLSAIVQDKAEDRLLTITKEFKKIEISDNLAPSNLIKPNPNNSCTTLQTKASNFTYDDKWGNDWDDFDTVQNTMSSLKSKNNSNTPKEDNIPTVNNEWTTIWEDTSKPSKLESNSKTTSKTNLDDWTTDWDDPEPVILKGHDRKSSTITNVSVDSDWSAEWEVKPNNKRNNSSKPFKDPRDSGEKIQPHSKNISRIKDYTPSEPNQQSTHPSYHHYQQQQQTTLQNNNNSQSGSGSWFSDFRLATRTAAVSTVTHAVKNWNFNPTNLLDSVVDNLGSVVGIPSAEEMASAMRKRDQTLEQPQSSGYKKADIEVPSQKIAYSKKK